MNLLTAFSEVSDILSSIEQKLWAMDIRISLIELLHKEFQKIKCSFNFSQNHKDTYVYRNSQSNIFYEHLSPDPEKTLKDFMTTQLKIPFHSMTSTA